MMDREKELALFEEEHPRPRGVLHSKARGFYPASSGSQMSTAFHSSAWVGWLSGRACSSEDAQDARRVIADAEDVLGEILFAMAGDNIADMPATHRIEGVKARLAGVWDQMELPT